MELIVNKNIAWRQPALHLHWYVSRLGLVTRMDELSSAEYIFVTQSGYVGKKPKTRPLPMNAYHINCQRISLSQSSAVYKYSNGDTEFANGPCLNQALGGATYYPSYDLTPLRNRCIAKLNDQVRGDLDVSVDLAEAGKTMKMLRFCDNAIAYSQMFKRRFGTLKAMSGAWLEYTYGIKPTVNTIFGTATELHNHAWNSSARYRARVKDVYEPEKVQLNTIWGPVWFALKGQRINVSMTIGVDVRTPETDPARFSSLNPLSIAWELTPYSFVVDWFWNLGGYLHGLETSLLWANKFRSGYETTLIRSDCSVQKSDVANDGAGNSHESYFQGYVKHVDIDRKILTSYPAPTLPSIDVSLGSSRLFSAAALLGQCLGRTKLPPAFGEVLNDKRLKKRIQEDSRYFLDKAYKRAVQFPKQYAHL